MRSPSCSPEAFYGRRRFGFVCSVAPRIRPSVFGRQANLQVSRRTRKSPSPRCAWVRPTHTTHTTHTTHATDRRGYSWRRALGRQLLPAARGRLPQAAFDGPPTAGRCLLPTPGRRLAAYCCGCVLCTASSGPHMAGRVSTATPKVCGASSHAFGYCRSATIHEPQAHRPPLWRSLGRRSGVALAPFARRSGVRRPRAARAWLGRPVGRTHEQAAPDRPRSFLLRRDIRDSRRLPFHPHASRTPELMLAKRFWRIGTKSVTHSEGLAARHCLWFLF